MWHFLGFAIPSTLAVLLIRRWWPVAVFAANAVVSELVQHFFLPNRAGDPTDLLAEKTVLDLQTRIAELRAMLPQRSMVTTFSPTPRTKP